jgi:hypothetical protein
MTIKVLITEDGEVKTERYATKTPDGRYEIDDWITGNYWYIRHAEQKGLNSLARAMLVKPTAGVSKRNVR